MREAAAREARNVLAQAHLDRAADETAAEAEESEREVLRGVSFEVARGEVVAVLAGCPTRLRPAPRLRPCQTLTYR